MITEAERALQRKAENLVRQEVYFNLSHWMQFAIASNCAGTPNQSCPVDVEEIPYDLPCEECHGTGYVIWPDGDGEPFDLDQHNERMVAQRIRKEADGDEDEIQEKLDALDWPRATCGPCKDDWIAVEPCNECDDGRVTVEIFEWWAVSSWLAGKLEAAGEVVLEGEIWGRQCTGQRMDGVIRGMAADLGRHKN